ncbi:hypothetical protein L1I30_10640 [Gillisia sp. M10.2A]|uniref:Uncharacterized protein n=1 Tax=Gillisia lutea TaxID=2909668 RepID=A0ABS9EGX0_9FLAO|nr:hypothetical protein [Gillisia lutea]MCF4102125.1 hypothetical protein [Gillisia lutea]
MKISLNKIAILTTVANFELYNKTSNLFPDGIRVYVIDGRNGMHGLHSILYMFKKLKGEGIDWLIMADEDVIFKKPQSVFSLIEFMNHNNYSACGVRDGGVIKHRNKNPFAINTFFSILDFKKISLLFKAREILGNQFIYKNEFPDNLNHLEFEFDKLSLYEPYYCFYFWLRRMGENILFLNSKTFENESDKISNEVFHPNGTSLLIHTWYARSYGINKKHTLRINRILNEIEFKSNVKKPIIYKDSFFYLKMQILKTAKKVIMKIP